MCFYFKFYTLCIFVCITLSHCVSCYCGHQVVFSSYCSWFVVIFARRLILLFIFIDSGRKCLTVLFCAAEVLGSECGERCEKKIHLFYSLPD